MFKNSHLMRKKRQTALVIGCGRLGANLAGSLCDKGYDTIVIDKDETAFGQLPDNFSGYQITGDGTDKNLLEKAGIGNADMVIAAAERDNINSLVCQMAGRIYQVPNVYMRLNDPNMEDIIEGYGIRVIYPFRLSVNEFERLSHAEA
ncbi:potassium channel family protein [Diplocloster modestus]|nr:TrkA family potassium uptake protein [Diplocloster modestus]